MIIILLGAPGSGKGTQSSLLVESLNALHISTGTILRQEITQKTALGLEVESVIKAGKLVSDDLINKIIDKQLRSIELETVNVILDGYPRNLSQAKFLDKSVQDNLRVIYLKLSDDELIKRLSGRFSCPTCQTIYNKYFDKPKMDEECNKCGKVQFVIRADDNEQTVVNRLNEYKQETEPLINYYLDKGVLSEVDSKKEKSEICQEILKLLKKA
ncbi:MAG: adk [Rickettsiaceae bacterium]|jgi:adenylate kinase|nr:adk [Rickettsiaceae bacterium]